MAWISNYIHVKQTDVINHSCPYLNGVFTKLWHRWMITSQRKWYMNEWLHPTSKCVCAYWSFPKSTFIPLSKKGSGGHRDNRTNDNKIKGKVRMWRGICGIGRKHVQRHLIFFPSHLRGGYYVRQQGQYTQLSEKYRPRWPDKLCWRRRLLCFRRTIYT